ncbi:MAG: hypothetical protein BWK75_05625 [Candidatus Altiarchaeales archaeon A3]|nr:MAG: hypothetical protein BWK75_05625 [Candidatus Altiarchaeales archaeon A3]
MNVSWINESIDVQEVGFNIKIYENKSYAKIKYIYRTKDAYVSLEPHCYGISFDKNKVTIQWVQNLSVKISKKYNFKNEIFEIHERSERKN